MYVHAMVQSHDSANNMAAGNETGVVNDAIVARASLDHAHRNVEPRPPPSVSGHSNDAKQFNVDVESVGERSTCVVERETYPQP